jgi:hypothetical protein
MGHGVMKTWRLWHGCKMSRTAQIVRLLPSNGPTFIANGPTFIGSLALIE